MADLLPDRIAKATADLEALRKQHASAVKHVARARSEHERTEEELQMRTGQLALAEVSAEHMMKGAAASAAANATTTATTGFGGVPGEDRKTRDRRLLRSTDLHAIADRMLELSILEGDVERAVSDAADCAAEWAGRAQNAAARLAAARAELARVPAAERGGLVATMEKFADLQAQHRRLRGELDDTRRVHRDKREVRANRVAQLQDRLLQLDVKLGRVRGDVRQVEREQAAYAARVQTMEEQRREYRVRLKEFVGDDELLRVSFKRYDTDQSGTLSVGEIYTATREVLLCESDEAAAGFSMADAEAQVAAYDRDGNGTLDFKEFKRMFRRLFRGKKTKHKK